MTDVVICCGHLARPICEFAGDGERFGLWVRYSEDGACALGTGGAIRHAPPLLGYRFVVMYGDSLLTASLGAMWRAFCAQDCAGMMAVYRNENRWDASNVEIREGRVLRHEKGRHDAGLTHMDYYVSAFRAAVFAGIPDGQTFDLGVVLQGVISGDGLACHEVRERVYEIGSFDGLRISIGGGGTDLPSYYGEFGGFVISAAINKYVFVTVNRSFFPGYFLKYSATEHVEERRAKRHPLLREALEMQGVNAPLEVVSVADVPAGTGLG